MSKTIIEQVSGEDLLIGKGITLIVAFAVINDLIAWITQTLFGWVWVVAFVCAAIAIHLFGTTIKDV